MLDRPLDSEAIAGRVADGEPVDWELTLRSASDDRERRVIRHLRLVESVAQVHRGVAPSSAPLDATISLRAPGRSVPTPANKTWAHLELRQKVGEGTFGEVYRAWDSRLEREVALKLLKTEPSSEKNLASKVIEEGRLLAKLHHPNVVTVFGAEVHESRVGLWMEFIRGRSLEQVLREHGPFGAREAVLIGIDVCRALAAVHRAGVVHRDVKAQNTMREEGGRILLMDFGAGVDVKAEQSAGDKSISGTPFYMSPELFLGEPATERSDIYSLGVLLYRLVTRSFPVEGRSWKELRERHARHEATLLRDLRSDLPEGFVKVVERAVAWDPSERFTTAGQMEQALSLTLGMESGPSTGRAVSRSADIDRPVAHTRRRLAFGIAGSVVAAALIVTAALLAPSLVTKRTVEPAAGRSALWDRPKVPVGPATVPETERQASPAGTVATAPYTVEAALYRVPADSHERERLEPGSRLSLGDQLTLDFRASTPLHVYIINEDEEGHAFALFPLPGLELQNPLPAGATHVLPGSRNGKDLSWTVDSAGGREHLLVLASPSRLVEFEAEMSLLAHPGQSAVSIPEAAKVHLRGLGGLTEAPAATSGKSAGHLFEMAQRLASRSEVAQGAWMRRIDLENPKPE